VLLADRAPEGQALVDAVGCGLHAVVPATASADVLLDAARRLASGDTLLAPRQLREAVDGLRRARMAHGPVDLSPREREILESIDRGESVKQTAYRLGISPRTVDNTQRILFRKLTARNRAQAVARAHALGLLHPEAS
jgi:DNA-binding NarL/FixJ family response regulator